MLRRRALPFFALAALVAVGPASAFSGGQGISGVLHAGAVSVMRTDKAKSCQAGGKSSQIIGSTKKPAVVACEQPPKSNLITPDSIAKATAAALAVIG